MIGKEKKLRLSQGSRVLAARGHGDLISGHLSCRAAGSEGRLLMKPSGIGLDEVVPESLLEVDFSGSKVGGGDGPVQNEVFIHTEIYKRRVDVQAVVHTHAPYAVAFSATGHNLRPIGHEGSLFADGLPVFRLTTDGIVDPERGQAVADLLGDHRALLLQNHGLVTVGETIEEAVMSAVWLEKACYMEFLVSVMGEARYWTQPEEALAKRARIYGKAAMVKTFDYCVRVLPTL